MSAVLIAAALVLAPPAPPAAAACAPAHATPTASGAPLKPRRLAELPPGYFIRAVLRRVGDCGVIDVRRDGEWVHELDGPAPTAPTRAVR